MKSFLFKESMFNQILERNKTQTRRVVTFKNPHPDLELADFAKESSKAWFKHPQGTYETIKSPKRVGEFCYLKEPYLLPDDTTYQYKFDFPVTTRDIRDWKNKLFMPESAARYFVKITNVGVEQLQEISEKDAIAEGIETVSDSILTEDTYYKLYDYKKPASTNLPHLSFMSLWKSIHKKVFTWGDNPWVWVYEFELIDKKKMYK